MANCIVHACFAGVWCLLATPTSAAPDEALLGKASGYPRGVPGNTSAERYKIGSFSAAADIFPSEAVAPSPTPLVLKTGTAPEIRYTFNGTQYSLEDYLARNRVTSLFIVKNGAVLFERYQYDRQPSDAFISFSMAKSITALLIGKAHEQGLIKSLDDTAQTYAPELKGSAYGATTVRHLLRMASGVRWSEDYSGQDDVADLFNALFRIGKGGDPTWVLTRQNQRIAPVGEQFKYATGETQVLCHVLRGATRRSISDLTQQWLWQPMGAESPAAWLVGWQKLAFCGGGFTATSRDYARLGMLLAQDGQRDGKAIIPKDYLLDATDYKRQPKGFGLNEAGRGFAYGYQFWLDATGSKAFAMLGVYGQAVWVVPSQQLVVVHTAAWPTSSNPNLAAERAALFRGIFASVAK